MLSFFKNEQRTQQKQLKKYQKKVNQINALEPKYTAFTDEQLRDMTSTFKQQLNDGKKIVDIIPDAFAVVREASKRVLGLRHFDVQLIGGLVLCEGNISEMATGEGKTLVASLPSYVLALEGKGVHVITVNEYLAQRDREIIGQIHEFLGLTVGLNLPMMQPQEKQAAYRADITYGVGTEFGFDYLRDNLVSNPAEKVQRPYHFAIIDEVDSVLIDEAKTPLIIAGKMASNTDLHYISARLAKSFEKDIHYTFDEETKATSLTDEGIEKVEKSFDVDNLYAIEHQTLYHYVIQGVRAHVMFKRDVDYIVKEGKILLVDMFTGRIMEGRSLSDGLHQAIEAKEGLVLTEENKTQASVTIQNYFRMYPMMAGMTGTAKTEEKEFNQVYGMQVVSIPTNRPKQRIDHPDRIYLTTEQKYKAMIKKVKECHATGQPILIGTTSILQSERVAKYLQKENLKYEILNAKSVEQEVRLISLAGQKGQITIATNMAGRGTDILLGEGVDKLGGLFVLGTEKHESRRVDNQLRGRSGRQGNPGASEFYISLQDDMFRRFASEEIEKIQKKLTADAEGLVTSKNILEFVDRTQRIVEGSFYSMREYNLKLDDVINEQRNIIYTLRNRMIAEEDLIELANQFISRSVKNEIGQIAIEDVDPEDWNMHELELELKALLASDELSLPDTVRSQQDLFDFLRPSKESHARQLQALKENQTFQHSLKYMMLSRLDLCWITHLELMTRLKEGISLRSYQQEDPLRIYQREGLELFTLSYNKIAKHIALDAANAVRATQQEEAV
ncbi:accessory Sec system translocase SecA2 [Bacillus sp. AGMB 02131]|uniref:Protein translocase subunit SecA n=1 Tax=Peribacillus faecalis TaxID=2772559 RepID=A0A927CVE0_9BACI|nr:accessory Sec system translocase SecA2 [Peribacillus faecalis]MBD3108512.1 accessory Sec system translocase SecA2 [Peribacillus faecalis]